MPGILVSVPNRGAIDPDMVMNLLAMYMPLYTDLIYFMPSGLPVDQARNESAAAAVKQDTEWLLFRDDDVLAPRDLITTLRARGADFICAPYTSKQKPPQMLMFSGDQPCVGWKPGDIVRCDEAAIGCSLIRTDIFRRLSEPWFAYTAERAGDGMSEVGSRCSEDIFFCRKVKKELGIDTLVDTSLTCYHLDVNTRERYFWDPRLNIGAWQTPFGMEMVVPPVGNPACPVVDLTKEATQGAEVHGSGSGGGDAGGPGDGDGGPEHHEPV
jgi:hypothetical protein